MSETTANPTAPAKSKGSEELKKVALQLFSNARGPIIASRHTIVKCFREAQMFLETWDDVQSGKLDLDAVDKNPLVDAYCPNLKKTFPDNLVSQQWGNLDRCIAAWDVIESEKVKSYSELDWGEIEVKRARILIPPVLEKARALGLLTASAN